MTTTTVRFRCYFCHRIHSVPEGAAGKRGRCVCGKLMLVPSVMAGEGAPSKSIPLALPPAVPPPGGEEDAADIDFAQKTAPASAAPAADEPSTTRLPPVEVTRPLPFRRGPVEIEAVAASRRESAKGGSRLLGSIYIVLSLVALGAWVLHQFFSGTHPIEGKLLWASDPNFIGLPAAFWSTVFLSLAIALLLEGVYRIRRA